MDTHETDAQAWSRQEPPATDTEEAGPVEEDVVVIESHETGYADSEAGQPEVAPAVAAAQAAEAGAPLGNGAPAAAAQQWSDIKAMFVDDPGESVKLASGLVEQAIENLVSSLRQRQQSLSSWEAGDASDTEGLRNVLRSYRNLFDQLDGMSSQFGSARERAGRS